MTRTLLAAAIAVAAAQPARAQYLPPDPQPTCTVTNPQFNAWWTSGAPVLDGDVAAADSLAFPNGPNCDFYRWSEQMYLWLTSPTSTGDIRLVASSSFFDVTPKDGSGARTLVPHAPGVLRITSVRTPPVGPNGLPLVMDRSGRAFEVERTTRTAGRGELRVRDLQGRWVAVEHARWGPRGELVLTDRAGREIHPAHPDQPGRVQRVVVDATPIFVTSAGTVADVEQGQADLNVLMSRSGSLVYYAINVNDVFAYYLTGFEHSAIGFSQFPTTPGQLSSVLSYAAANGATIADGNALAMEVKSSWVEASTLADPTKFIRMKAAVPVYDRSNPAKWTSTGTTTTVELAMVGLHIAGSVRGHPEMIWATFEHENNAPNDRYTYVNTAGVTTFVPRNTTGAWLFSASGATSFNASNQALDLVSGDILASGAPTISPSDTLRSKAWGTGFDAPNAPFLNTEVISINNSVLSRIPAADVRRRYRFIGAVWLGPAGAAGTTSLANATLETTQQGDSTRGTGRGCLDCHTGTAASSVSQIFGDITPLF